jgi:hypothetical protein
VGRGRVTIDRFRHWALQTGKKHRASPDVSSKTNQVTAVAAELRRLWFRAADSDEVAASKGKEAAGLLGHTIWWHFHERLKGRNDLRVVHLSCHDYTVRARPGRLSALRVPGRVPLTIRFVGGFCMGAQGA